MRFGVYIRKSCLPLYGTVEFENISVTICAILNQMFSHYHLRLRLMQYNPVHHRCVRLVAIIGELTSSLFLLSSLMEVNGDGQTGCLYLSGVQRLRRLLVCHSNKEHGK